MAKPPPVEPMDKLVASLAKEIDRQRGSGQKVLAIQFGPQTYARIGKEFPGPKPGTVIASLHGVPIQKGLHEPFTLVLAAPPN